MTDSVYQHSHFLIETFLWLAQSWHNAVVGLMALDVHNFSQILVLNVIHGTSSEELGKGDQLVSQV